MTDQDQKRNRAKVTAWLSRLGASRSAAGPSDAPTEEYEMTRPGARTGALEEGRVAGAEAPTIGSLSIAEADGRTDSTAPSQVSAPGAFPTDARLRREEDRRRAQAARDGKVLTKQAKLDLHMAFAAAAEYDGIEADPEVVAFALAEAMKYGPGRRQTPGKALNGIQLRDRIPDSLHRLWLAGSSEIDDAAVRQRSKSEFLSALHNPLASAAVQSVTYVGNPFLGAEGQFPSPGDSTGVSLAVGFANPIITSWVQTRAANLAFNGRMGTTFQTEENEEHVNYKEWPSAFMKTVDTMTDELIVADEGFARARDVIRRAARPEHGDGESDEGAEPGGPLSDQAIESFVGSASDEAKNEVRAACLGTIEAGVRAAQGQKDALMLQMAVGVQYKGQEIRNAATLLRPIVPALLSVFTEREGKFAGFADIPDIARDKSAKIAASLYVANTIAQSLLAGWDETRKQVAIDKWAMCFDSSVFKDEVQNDILMGKIPEPGDIDVTRPPKQRVFPEQRVLIENRKQLSKMLDVVEADIAAAAERMAEGGDLDPARLSEEDRAMQRDAHELAQLQAESLRRQIGAIDNKDATALEDDDELVAGVLRENKSIVARFFDEETIAGRALKAKKTVQEYKDQLVQRMSGNYTGVIAGAGTTPAFTSVPTALLGGASKVTPAVPIATTVATAALALVGNLAGPQAIVAKMVNRAYVKAGKGSQIGKQIFRSIFEIWSMPWHALQRERGNKAVADALDTMLGDRDEALRILAALDRAESGEEAQAPGGDEAAGPDETIDELLGVDEPHPSGDHRAAATPQDTEAGDPGHAVETLARRLKRDLDDGQEISEERTAQLSRIARLTVDAKARGTARRARLAEVRRRKLAELDSDDEAADLEAQQSEAGGGQAAAAAHERDERAGRAAA